MTEEQGLIIEWLECDSCHSKLRVDHPNTDLPDDYDPDDIACPACSQSKMHHSQLSYRIPKLPEVAQNALLSAPARGRVNDIITALEEEGEAE